MALTRIHIEIGEVVLHGAPPGERQRVGDALRAGIERALSQPGALDAFTKGRSLDRLVLPAIREEVRGERLGAAVADALVAGLGAMDSQWP